MALGSKWFRDHQFFGRLLADYASTLISLYSVNVTFLAEFVELSSLKHFTREAHRLSDS